MFLRSFLEGSARTRTATESLTAYKRAAEPEFAVAYMGSLVSILAKAEDTGGRFALMEVEVRPGDEPPPVVHEREHKVLYVFEGQIDVYTDDKVLAVRCGEMMFLPEGKPHAYYVRTPHVRMLVLLQATGEHVVGLRGHGIEQGNPVNPISHGRALRPIAVDPTTSLASAAKDGVRILSPSEAMAAMPNYPGYGVNPELMGEMEAHLSAYAA